jgi:hypothetical protein
VKVKCRPSRVETADRSSRIAAAEAQLAAPKQALIALARGRIIIFLLVETGHQAGRTR